MCKNVGNLDSGIRVVLGTAILVLGTYYQSWWGLIGLLPLLEGIFHYCPLYALFKWNTTCCCGEKSCCCSEEAPKATKKKKK